MTSINPQDVLPFAHRYAGSRDRGQGFRNSPGSSSTPPVGGNSSGPGGQDYLHDFFLSYRAEGARDGWIHKTLLPTLKLQFLRQWGREPRIYDFRYMPEHGSDWRIALSQDLLRSRYLLPLWCAGYFQSRTCMWELEMVRRKERSLELKTLGRPLGLILPLVLADGRSFPEYVSQMQVLDLRPYVYSSSAFKHSAKFLDFEDILREWVVRACHLLETVPAYREDWMKEPPLPLPIVPIKDDWSPLM